MVGTLPLLAMRRGGTAKCVDAPEIPFFSMGIADAGDYERAIDEDAICKPAFLLHTKSASQISTTFSEYESRFSG